MLILRNLKPYCPVPDVGTDYATPDLVLVPDFPIGTN